jgi:hypothetical protein
MKNRIVRNAGKVVITTAVAYVLGVAPASVYAQSNQPLTRAQIRAELVQLEKAGYSPSAKDNRYPERLQAAETRVAHEQGEEQTAYGSPAVSATQSGGSVVSSRAKEVSGAESLYFGH